MASRWFPTCVLIGLAFHAAPAMAIEPYPVGWYDTLEAPGHPAEINAVGGNVSLAYWGLSNTLGEPVTDQYLDNALLRGVRVIFEIDPVAIDAQDVQAIRDIVSYYDDHPAVIGWYTYDEPWVRGTPLSVLQTAYNAVKLESTKPVFMTIEEPAVAIGIPAAYKTAYDIFLADSYPFRRGETEFTGLEINQPGRPYKGDWKGDMQRAAVQSQLADRPWWAAMQGWGDAQGDTANYRLPTYNEARFMNYFSISEETSGLMHFPFYRALLFTPARPGEPYPHNGVTWLDEIWRSLAQQANILGPALQGGKIDGIVSDDVPDILSDMYQDPNTGDYYLITLNETAGQELANFTLNLPAEFSSITRLFEDNSDVTFANGQFSDTFSDYEVHVYLLSTIPEPASTGILLTAGILALAQRNRKRLP